MSYYWLKRKELMQKVWDKCHNKGGKEKPAKYYAANREVLRENARNKYGDQSIKTSEKSLKFGEAVVNKKEFYTSKQSIDLSLVDTDKIK